MDGWMDSQLQLNVVAFVYYQACRRIWVGHAPVRFIESTVLHFYRTQPVTPVSPLGLTDWSATAGKQPDSWKAGSRCARPGSR